MVLCFAACCSHQTVRNHCSFFRFPKDEKLKALWTNMSRRADKKPNDDSRLCSCHFEDGKKENNPTIFSYREKTKFDFPSPEKRTRRKKTQLRRNAVSPCKLSRPVESREVGVDASKKKAQKRKSHSDSEMSEAVKVPFKYCLVPCCTSTTVNTPEKLFFCVPYDKVKRKAWTVAMRRDEKKNPPLSTKTTHHCCEDHFSLKDDMENYWQWRLTNDVKRLKLKVGTVPHRFECQKRTLLPQTAAFNEEVGTTPKTNDGVKKKIHSSEMNAISLPVADEQLNTECIEVNPDILLGAGCGNFDFSETLQSSHSETEVMPEITDRVIGDTGASDEETNFPPRNESVEFLKQKLKELSATNEKLEKRLAESRTLCQLYLKENANLKEVIDNLRQIISVSNDS